MATEMSGGKNRKMTRVTAPPGTGHHCRTRRAGEGEGEGGSKREKVEEGRGKKERGVEGWASSFSYVFQGGL